MRSDAIVIKGVHDVGSSNTTDQKRLDNFESKIDSLTTLVTQLVVNQKSAAARLCGICTSSSHPTDYCPQVQEAAGPDAPQAYAANI